MLKQSNLPIALGAGLISAVVFASATTGPTLARIMLLAAATLPIALAGFSYNAATAFVAALIATALIAFLTTMAAGLAFAFTLALPAAYLVYLALLHRDVSPGSTQWYPIGRIILAAALMGASVVAVGLTVAGSTPEKLHSAVSTAIEQMVKSGFGGLPGSGTLSPADLERATQMMVGLLPGVSATFWMGCILFCQWAGARVALASGQLIRPWPDLAAFQLPQGTPLLLGLALAASLVLDGMPRLVAMGYGGALYAVFVMLGLAVIHFVTRGVAWRGPALAVTYTVLLIFSSGASLLLALLGLASSFFVLRRPVEPDNSNQNS